MRARIVRAPLSMENCFPTYKQHLDRHMPYSERFRPSKWDRGINGWQQDAQRCLGSWLLLISVGFKQPLHLCGSGSIWHFACFRLTFFFPPWTDIITQKNTSCSGFKRQGWAGVWAAKPHKSGFLGAGTLCALYPITAVTHLIPSLQ